MKANTTSHTRPMQINKRKPVVLDRDRTVISTSPAVVQVTHPEPTTRPVRWTARVVATDTGVEEADYPVLSGIRSLALDVKDMGWKEKQDVQVEYLERLVPLCTPDVLEFLNECLKDQTMLVKITSKEEGVVEEVPAETAH